jgi:beta-xylosidase
MAVTRLVVVVALGVAMLVAPEAAAGGVLQVAHRAVVRSCAYARTHSNSRTRARAMRACPATRHRHKRVRGAAAVSSYQNPLSGSSPDPSALHDGSGSDYYLYTTGDLFPMQHSTDLVHWTSLGTAFTQRPSWVVQSADWHPWSPSVLRHDGPCPGSTSPSCYYLFYTGLSEQYATNCVAVATATTPGGPFTDRGPLAGPALGQLANGLLGPLVGLLNTIVRPIGCGDGEGYGNIDPAPFVDSDGRAYLYVSTDWACPPSSILCAPVNSELLPTISVIPLGPSLLAASGPRTPLFSGDQEWEQAPLASVVEGPWVEKHGGAYYLFYSGGDWTHDYGMGDAILSSPLGPASKDPGNPILFGTKQVYSPGGGSTITGPGRLDWMLYHARLGGYQQPRELFIDRVVWTRDRSVTIHGPTATRQYPAP